MNKIAYMLLSAFVLLLSGCDKEGDKQVDITGGPAALSLSSADANVQIADGNRSGTVVFKTGGGSSHIDVATDRHAWTIGNTGDQWLTAEQDATGLVLKTAANTGSETLTATVTITAGSGEGAATATLEVSQRSAGDPDLTLDTHEVVFSPKDTEPKTVGVTTNQDDWTFETSSPSYWLLIEKGPDNTLVLTPDPNKMTENETIVVKVKAGYGNRHQDLVAPGKNRRAASHTKPAGPGVSCIPGSGYFIDRVSIPTRFATCFPIPAISRPEPEQVPCKYKRNLPKHDPCGF